MKGGSGLRFVSFLSIEVTVKRLLQRLHEARGLIAVSDLGLLARDLDELASKGGGLAPSRAAVIVQYSSGLKVRISSSRSQTIRTATD